MRITDDLNEIYDVVDKDDKVVGRAMRKEVHSNNKLIHRSVGILIFNNNGELFIQQRSKGKDREPLRWTLSVSGHVGSGDSYLSAAKRELSEELGIELRLTKYSKPFISSDDSETEMVMLFMAKSQGPFVLNRTEIERGMFIGNKELRRKVRSNEIMLSYFAEVALKKLGWL